MPARPATRRRARRRARARSPSFKKTALMVFGLAMQTFGTKLTDEQEVLMHLADITIDVFSAESAVLRAQAAARRRSAPRASLHADAARVFVNDAAMRIDASARQALAATVEGDTLRTMLAALRRLLKVDADQHRRGAAAPRRRDGRARRVSAIVGRMGRTGGIGWMGRRHAWRERLGFPSCPSCPSRPSCARGGRLCCCASCRSKPPRRAEGLRRQDRGGAGGQGRRVRRGGRSDPDGAGTRSFCRWPTSRSIRTTTRRAR